MSDTRSHRGPHPEDRELFAPGHWPALRAANRELCWLLDRGYAPRSALALTGDRHALVQRQRLAVARCACSREQIESRLSRHVSTESLRESELWIDGYNLLITVEAALAGGIVITGRDRCYRDMASLHGTYREVEETSRAAHLIGSAVAKWGVSRCHWLLDRPVGNSGRLRTTLLEIAQQSGWPWEVDLELSPDKILSGTSGVVATSDSVILDRCRRWYNAAGGIIRGSAPSATIIDLNFVADDSPTPST
jgi:hypothetical protein